jgi:hypothetical protein
VVIHLITIQESLDHWGEAEALLEEEFINQIVK